MVELIYKEESYKIIGACLSVHKKLGSGFLESVYSEALEMEFKKTEIPYFREKKLPVFYDDVKLKNTLLPTLSVLNQLFWNLKPPNS
jgi:GxxExxY protein